MFSRFFKPRWQHADAKIREQAIASLNPANSDEHSALVALAKDDVSAAVRSAAAARLIDLSILDSIIQQDKEQSVREAASERIQALLIGNTEPGLPAAQRLQVIALTDNQAVLAAVALAATDSTIRLAAANRITDQRLLLTLTLDGADLELRLSAAERIDDATLLRRLSRDGRDKKVTQLAREKLKDQQQQQQDKSQHQQRAQELNELLLAHSKRPFDNLYAARLQQLSSSWQEVRSDLDAEGIAAGDQLVALCQQRVDEWQQQQDQQQAMLQAQQELAAAASTLEESFQALLDAPQWSPANSMAALLASQQRRWQEASLLTDADATLKQRYLAIEQRWSLLIEQWGQFDQQQQPQPWPEHLPLPPTLREQRALAQLQANDAKEKVAQESAVSTALDEAKSSKETNDLERTLAVLNSALRRRQLKLSNRLWHKLEQLQDSLSAAQQGRMEKLKPQLDELRDWHAFAAEPKKLQLCEQMEDLVKADMPPQERADVVQLLQDQWRELMSADQQSDQALWDRFRAAADLAWEPCKEHFAELDRERAANLVKRSALCDQLEQYLDALDPDAVSDWSAVAEIRRTAPQEWKSYQPVRFTDLREVNKRFSDLLTRFDKLLDDVAAKHGAELEALIIEAQALASQDDSRQSAELFKALQKRWQSVGWVPVNNQRKLYRRFRSLADKVFADRQEQQQAERQQHSVEAEALRKELHNLEQAIAQADDDNAMKLLAEMAEHISALPCPSREDKLQQQRDNLIREARARRQRWPQWQRWSALKASIESAPTIEENEAQQELAVALETTAGMPSPEHAKQQRMQWQLQQLPNAMKGGETGTPIERCRALLEKSAVLNEGMSDSIRGRILSVWASLEPKV